MLTTTAWNLNDERRRPNRIQNAPFDVQNLDREIQVRNQPWAYTVGKRTFDIIFSALALIVLSPLFLVVGILIKITSKGPIIFAQTRVKQGGKTFTMYKFRTMVPDAEQRKESLMSLNEQEGPVLKLKRTHALQK